MNIAARVVLADHRHLTAVVDRGFPPRAFHGATMDALTDPAVLAVIEGGGYDRVQAFIERFLTPRDPDAIYTGYPERCFLTYVLDLRAEGHAPAAICDVMRAEFGLIAYEGDVRSFLDQSIRTLEATAALARIDPPVQAASLYGELASQLTQPR
jgi:superfamily II helicase